MHLRPVMATSPAKVRRPFHRPSPHMGFTLFELLVVITILGLLTSMLLPAVKIVQNRARQVACATHLRQIGMTLNAYGNDNEGMLANIYNTTVNPRIRWSDLISPYAEVGNTATGLLDVTQANRSIMSGCPEWKRNNITVSALGYGMTPFPDQPARQYANNCIDPPGGPYTLGVPFSEFLIGALSYPSARLLIADANEITTNNNGYGPAAALVRHSGRLNVLFADMHVQPLRSATQLMQAMSFPNLGPP